MIYEPRWKKLALDQLTLIWMAADSGLRSLITDASHAIDFRLQTNLEEQGEFRPFDRRILYEPPLAVTFKVDHAKQRVYILDVWLIRPKRKPT